MYSPMKKWRFRLLAALPGHSFDFTSRFEKTLFMLDQRILGVRYMQIGLGLEPLGLSQVEYERWVPPQVSGFG